MPSFHALCRKNKTLNKCSYVFVAVYQFVTFQTLDVHPLAVASHFRLLETAPTLFVFETSYYAFCGRYCFEYYVASQT